MLVKWIVCTVAPEKRDLFSQAQAKWRDLRHVPGFLGQVGGWRVGNPSDACILALWENEELYKEFMENHHDPIYEKTNQRGTYEGIKVTVSRLVGGILCSHDHILQSLHEAAFLRVGAWENEEGMLAGMLCESNLVLTIWKGEASQNGDMVGVQPMWGVYTSRKIS